uniref:Uncharacterized protein n=1 Tax=Bactrocera dorsalis TaxID=27457 RepID=A0A034V616_BACDO
MLRGAAWISQSSSGTVQLITLRLLLKMKGKPYAAGSSKIAAVISRRHRKLCWRVVILRALQLQLSQPLRVTAVNMFQLLSSKSRCGVVGSGNYAIQLHTRHLASTVRRLISIYRSSHC